MGDFLYFVFVFPLESLLAAACRAIFNVIPNEAAAIILLSLFINIFLLKIFTLTDKRANFEAARKKRFDALIRSWKSVYSKAKVFAFTQTLYKQNHYHPIFALSALGGLAIQIPFFYAMYFVIKNGNALPNVDFPSITALDAALKIHVLPILMTLITLANVFLSSKESSARIQGTVIAVLFLVLLYEMPHALVLYWTTNMAFSLSRVVFNKFKSPEIQTTPKIEKLPKAKKNFSPFLKIARKTLTFLGFLSAFGFVFAISQATDSPNYENLTQALNIYFIVFSLLVFFYFLFLYLQKNHSNINKITNLSIINNAFLICVTTPLTLYQSDITQFHPSFTLPTLASIFGIFLLVSFLFIYLLYFVPKKYKNIITFLFGVLFIFGAFNSFIFTGNYGEMDRFVFKIPLYPTAEKNLWNSATFCCVLILSSAIFYFLYSYFKTILKISFLTLFTVALFHSFFIFQMRGEADKIFEQYYSANSKNENPLFSYSKTDKNIVVLVLDMFTGSHMPYLFKFFPNLKTQLDGFLLFDNTVSSSFLTHLTLPSLIGGEYYTMTQQKQRGDDLDEATAKAYFNTGNAFAQAGYSVGFLAYSQKASEKMRQNPSVFWLDDQRDLQQIFLKGNAQSAFKDSYHFDIAHLFSFGIFKFAPDGAVRRAIYNDGAWFSAERAMDYSRVIEHIASLYAFMKTNNSNAQQPTFKFIHSDITHFPFGINAKGGRCNFLESGSIWQEPELFVAKNLKRLSTREHFIVEQHFDTEACALFLIADFVEWLKSENIYDNTQILIVSDHAGYDSLFNVPALSQHQNTGQDVLFLFKDFKARGELKTDSRLMANFDVATIFCANLENGCPDVAPNILQNYPENRKVLHWRDDDLRFEIQGNLYDSKAYKQISTVNAQ